MTQTKGERIPGSHSWVSGSVRGLTGDGPCGAPTGCPQGSKLSRRWWKLRALPYNGSQRRGLWRVSSGKGQRHSRERSWLNQSRELCSRRGNRGVRSPLPLSWHGLMDWKLCPLLYLQHQQNANIYHLLLHYSAKRLDPPKQRLWGCWKLTRFPPRSFRPREAHVCRSVLHINSHVNNIALSRPCGCLRSAPFSAQTDLSWGWALPVSWESGTQPRGWSTGSAAPRCCPCRAASHGASAQPRAGDTSCPPAVPGRSQRTWPCLAAVMTTASLSQIPKMLVSLALCSFLQELMVLPGAQVWAGAREVTLRTGAGGILGSFQAALLWKGCWV